MAQAKTQTQDEANAGPELDLVWVLITSTDVQNQLKIHEIYQSVHNESDWGSALSIE